MTRENTKYGEQLENHEWHESELPQDNRDDDMTDERTPTHCPHCGASGENTAFGSLSRWPREISRVRSGVQKRIKQTWFHFHCPECGNETAMLEDSEVVEVVEKL